MKQKLYNDEDDTDNDDDNDDDDEDDFQLIGQEVSSGIIILIIKPTRCTNFSNLFLNKTN